MPDLSSLEGQQQLRALAEATTPGPWAFAYCGVFSVPKVITEEQWWTDERMDDGHSYDHRAGQVCEACGPRFIKGTTSQMWDCALAGEALDQDHMVAHVKPSYGDTATGQRLADAEFIAAAREAVPALLDLVQQLTDENRQLRQTLRDVKRIGSSSGINLNAWNLAFDVIDAALSPVAASSGGTP